MPIGYHKENSEGEFSCYLRALLVECKYIATETTLQKSIEIPIQLYALSNL